jgi:hypothetical protein
MKRTCFAFLVLVLHGCTGDRDRLEADHLAAADDLSRVLWGQPLETTARDRERATFRCVWDAIEDTGGDAAIDLACFARRRRASVACVRDRAGSERSQDCLGESESVCPVSTAFESATRRCRPGGPG